MTVVVVRKVVDATSGLYLSKLRGLRRKISQKEDEVDEVVSKARRGSDCRVQRAREQLTAEDQLEDTLLELTELRHRTNVMMETYTKAKPVLEEDVKAKRLDLLAASPPFVLKLEQALVIVTHVRKQQGTSLLGTHTRWRSSLRSLMKDTVNGIDRYRQLSSRSTTVDNGNHGSSNRDSSNNSNHTCGRLALASVAARRFSLHVNAWTPTQLTLELERIWLEVIEAEAGCNPQFRPVLRAWRSACEKVGSCESTALKVVNSRKAEEAKIVMRIRDHQAKAKIKRRGQRTGWWRETEATLLKGELDHIERKIAPLASPTQLAARYNILKAKCAEAGQWDTAVLAYRSMVARGGTRTSPNVMRGQKRLRCGLKQSNSKGRATSGKDTTSVDPVVYHHLLRAAKNASPPQPLLAILILREMRLRGEAVNASHYNILISACARSAAAAASRSVLTRLTDSGDSHDNCCNRDKINEGYTAMDCRKEQYQETPHNPAHGKKHDGRSCRQQRSDGEGQERVASEYTESVGNRPIHIGGGTDNECGKPNMVSDSTPNAAIGQGREARINSVILGADKFTSLSRAMAVLACNPVKDDQAGRSTASSHPDLLLAGVEAIQADRLGPTTAGDAVRLALEILANMREREVTPTEATFGAIVECCRCSGAASSLKEEDGNRDGVGVGSTPPDLYSALKEAGVPRRYCYQAGLKGALRRDKTYPAYVAEMYR